MIFQVKFCLAHALKFFGISGYRPRRIIVIDSAQLELGLRVAGPRGTVVVAGGIPLVLTTLGFTFLGESLRDIFDPKLNKER